MRTVGMAPITLNRSSVIVLGGTGALGSRIASELVSHGANVTVTGRDLARASDVARSIGAVAAAVDLRTPETHAAPIDAARNAFGSIDGIVNAAGVVAFGPLSETPPAVIEDVIATNLTGPLEFYARAIPVMDGGFIANLTGIVASMPTAGMATYSASKAGLSAATIALAREVRRSGLLVIDMQPPHTETGLTDRAIHGSAPSLPTGLDPDLVASRCVAGIAGGKRAVDAEWFTSAA